MFDLEKAIAHWRHEIKAKWTGNTAELDELEDHLREDSAALVRGGNTEEQAWHAALARLGDPVALRHEFAKVEPLPRFDRFMLGTMAACAAMLILAFGIMFATQANTLADDPMLIVHIVTITLGYTTGIFAAVLAGYITVRTLPRHRSITGLQSVSKPWLHVACIAAAALTIVGFTFGTIWANGALGQAFSFDPREVGALFVAAGFIAGAIATRRNTQSVAFSQALPTLGGGLVLAAWGVTAHVNGYPTLLTAIGFGGLAVSLTVAALAIRKHHVTA
jgi:hypothetical protein